MTDLTSLFNDLRVLILDDKNTADMSGKIASLFKGVEPVTVSTVNGAKQYIDRQYWDIVALDLNMAEDSELPLAERPAGGFYAYFHLREVMYIAPQNTLPPLIIMYTGDSHLEISLRPFFPIPEHKLSDKTLEEILDEELRRKKPFSIVQKEGMSEELKRQLICLEVSRFYNNYKWLRSGHETLEILDRMTKFALSPEERAKLANIELADGLPLRRVMPTLVGQVVKGNREYAPLLKRVLTNQNWLAKLNNLFLDDQPGGGLLHSRKEELGEFMRRLGTLDKETQGHILEELGIDIDDNERRSFRDYGSEHEWKDRVDNDNKFIEGRYKEWRNAKGEAFKAKWRCWDKERKVTNGQRTTTSHKTLLAHLEEVAESVAGGVRVETVVTPSEGESNMPKLYMSPYVLERLVREAIDNSVTKGGLDAVETAIIKLHAVDDRQSNAVRLDITDNGTGFDHQQVSWKQTITDWQELLRGWGVVELYTRHNGETWVMSEEGVRRLEAFTELPNGFGTLVRVTFAHRHDWEQGT